MMVRRRNVREFWLVIFSHDTTLPALATLNEHHDEDVEDEENEEKEDVSEENEKEDEKDDEKEDEKDEKEDVTEKSSAAPW